MCRVSRGHIGIRIPAEDYGWWCWPHLRTPIITDVHQLPSTYTSRHLHTPITIHLIVLIHMKSQYVQTRVVSQNALFDERKGPMHFIIRDKMKNNTLMMTDKFFGDRGGERRLSFTKQWSLWCDRSTFVVELSLLY